jgi:hypothetical protein
MPSLKDLEKLEIEYYKSNMDQSLMNPALSSCSADTRLNTANSNRSRGSHCSNDDYNRRQENIEKKRNEMIEKLKRDIEMIEPKLDNAINTVLLKAPISKMFRKSYQD